jgi:uncharacterized protein (TIGR00299 family) protein
MGGPSLVILYYDCFAGISGDMNLGALIDLGIDASFLLEHLKKLPLPDIEIEVSKESRRGIAGTRFRTVRTEHPERPRSYGDIRELIGRAPLPDPVRRRSLRIFRRIAEAESKIHGTAPEAVHFHEIGAADSIVDIVGHALCIECLGVDAVVSSPPELGGGLVSSRHGILPVPAPATLEILSGIPVRIGGVDHEATTPTGAAILAESADLFSNRISIRPEKIGYGIGARDPEVPNVLRAVLGEASGEDFLPWGDDRKIVTECTIDDMNPEFYDHILQRLLKAGAADVFLTPVIMKKSRPGTNVTVLSDPAAAKAVEDILLEETTTLGVRRHPVERRTLRRETETVSTRYGPVRVKHAFRNGRKIRTKPEFEDCRRLADEKGVSLWEILRSIGEEVGGK